MRMIDAAYVRVVSNYAKMCEWLIHTGLCNIGNITRLIFLSRSSENNNKTITILLFNF